MLLERKWGAGRRCKSEADAAGRHGVLVFRGVKRGKHGEPISHFDAWNGVTAVDPASDWWKAATQKGAGGVLLFELKH